MVTGIRIEGLKKKNFKNKLKNKNSMSPLTPNSHLNGTHLQYALERFSDFPPSSVLEFA